MLVLSACFGSDEKKSPRSPSSIDENGNKIAPQNDAIQHVVEDSLQDPSVRSQVEAELRKAFLSDPSEDNGKGPILTAAERASANEGFDQKLLEHTSEATEAAKEIGQMSRGLLGNLKIQFNPNEEFRCVSVEENPLAEKSEVLVSKSVVGEVTMLRFRPHQGLDPSGGSDFAARRTLNSGQLIYESDDKLVMFSIQGSMDVDPETKASATLKGTIKDKEVNKDFVCTKGKI